SFVAPPAVGAFQFGDERRGGHRVEADEGGGTAAFGIDAVDAAAIIAIAEEAGHFFGAAGREPFGVFDHVAVHVDDPEGAVGAHAGHHGAAPGVLGGEELAV